MIFNMFFDLCKSKDIDYEVVKNAMFKNDWINPMHTDVPGHDGQLAYGGACFTKDTNALLEFCIRNGIQNKILDACIKERNIIREDNQNIEE